MLHEILINQTTSYPLYKQPNSVRGCYVPPRGDQFGYPHVAGRRFENNNFSNTPVAIRRHNLKASVNHVNADATDETKIVTTKFVLGFCHGQLRFCLLVRIGPYFAMSTRMPPEGSEIFHRKESFLSFPVRLWGENWRGKEFDPIHDHRVNGKSLFATFQARRSKKRCNRPHLASGCWHLAQCFHWFQRRGQLKFIRLVIPP